MAALLMLVVTALAPVAAASSPSASPGASGDQGVPVVVGVIPDPNQGAAVGTKNLWSGDVVQVNFEPNGSELDLAQCQVFINGALQKLVAEPLVQYL